MTNFTKQELEDLQYALETVYMGNSDLRHKILDMIDNYTEENEIHSCYTGLALGDDFFCGKQHMTEEDLFPMLHELMRLCDGIIRESGIYAFKLRVVKIK